MKRGSGARRVGHYRIEGELGRGGMGVVYRAFDERLHRDVALKALPAEVAADATERARLEREARAIASISHPNVASIFGMEESGGATCLVFELVEGETLRKRLDGSRLAHDEALALCAQVAAGLDAVHRRGLVHRDLKPSNVMVTGEGAVKLLDFGLACRAQTAQGDLTRRGEVLGTSGWMSPEQLRGEEIDARSDAWAWGCLLYECLAGAPAFPGATWRDREAATLRDEPDWSLLPETSPQVVELLQSCLSKDRARRPATLEKVRRMLEEARQSPSERRRVAALPKHSLPAERDRFVGRESELAELDALVESGARLVSVLGFGGTGKTRLVLHHAHRSLSRFEGGAWFCDLSEARSVEGIASAVAKALDVPLGPGDAIAQLGHVIAGRARCLIILDNFEQVARHAAETLGHWLDRAGDATFVVTTREVLGVRGEQSLPLAPLGQQDAAELFLARAKSARPSFAPGDVELGEIATLVALLDHLPLAIELAAARVRVMPVVQVLARMKDRFKLLSASGTRRDRQATLRATLDWSWELLSADERMALAQLSVFEGGFTLESAEAVLALQELWPTDAVQALVDKSWVRPVPETRFDLLVTVQEYGAERLDAFGGRAEAESRHGAHFASFGSEESLGALWRHGGAQRILALSQELDNMIAACRRAAERGDASSAVATLCVAWTVLSMRGPFAPGIALAQAVVGMPGIAPTLQVRALEELADAHRMSGDPESAHGLYERALAIHREAGDRRNEGKVIANMALLQAEQGRLQLAREWHEKALAIHREVGNRRFEGIVLHNIGNVLAQQGRIEDARHHLESAVAIFREIGDRRNEGSVVGVLAIIHDQQGRLDEALEHYQRALAICGDHGDRGGAVWVLGNIGVALRERGRLAEARSYFERSLALGREVGNRRAEGHMRSNLAHVYKDEGRLDEARAQFELALAVLRSLGNKRSEGFTIGQLADVCLEKDELAGARAHLDVADHLVRDAGGGLELAGFLCIRARLEAREGQADAARATLAEAEAMRADIGSGADSELAREIARARAVIEGVAP